jgi:hypothetical protein
MSNKKHKHLDKKIDWSNAIAKAERQLGRNKVAIESSVMGTPSNWSRPTYNKPAVAPDQSPPDEQVKKPKKLTKQQRRAKNKVFVPQQKKKAKRSDESGGLPVVKKV